MGEIVKKTFLISFLLTLFTLSQFGQISFAEELTKKELLAEIKLMKIRMTQLEETLKRFTEGASESEKEPTTWIPTNAKILPSGNVEEANKCSAEKLSPKPENRPILRQGERGVAGHLRALEKRGTEYIASDLPDPENNNILRQGERGVAGHLQALKKRGQGLEFSGSLEIEAGYESFKGKGSKNEDTSFLDLATVELVVDAYLPNSLKAHIIFDYEEGEGVNIDEAMLHFQAEDVCQPDCSCDSPWFASLGRMTVPFGYYESHFITDPLTLVLGETQEVAALGGIHSGPFTFAAGVYNGDMDEAGKEDHIDKFVGAAFFRLNERVLPNLTLFSGISYISNIADSNELTDFFDDEFGTDTLIARVDGISAFLSLSFREVFAFEAEWVSALDSFKEDKRFEPKAWNLELAFRPLETMEIGLRYSGSDDALNFLPETQYGVIAAYEIFENTSIGIEYLHESFDNRDKINRVTTQIGVQF